MKNAGLKGNEAQDMLKMQRNIKLLNKGSSKLLKLNFNEDKKELKDSTSLIVSSKYKKTVKVEE